MTNEELINELATKRQNYYCRFYGPVAKDLSFWINMIAKDYQEFLAKGNPKSCHFYRSIERRICSNGEIGCGEHDRTFKMIFEDGRWES